MGRDPRKVWFAPNDLVHPVEGDARKPLSVRLASLRKLNLNGKRWFAVLPFRVRRRCRNS
jgi:hypothetical protein